MNRIIFYVRAGTNSEVVGNWYYDPSKVPQKGCGVLLENKDYRVEDLRWDFHAMQVFVYVMVV